MAQRIIQAIEYQCERCLYKWISRIEKTKPRCCPKCKNYLWEKPRMLKETESYYFDLISYDDSKDTPEYSLIRDDFLVSDPRYPSKDELVEVSEILKSKRFKNDKDRKDKAQALMTYFLKSRKKK